MKDRRSSLFRSLLFLSILLPALNSCFGIISAVAGTPINSISLTSHIRLEDQDSVKDLTWSDTSGDGDITKSGSKYWITNLKWKKEPEEGYWSFGDKPQVIVTLEAGDENYFLDRYSAKNVTVNNGKFISSKRKSSQKLEITIEIKPVKGRVDGPDEAYWSADKLGTGKWSKVEGVGAYEAKLYRNSTLVHRYERIGGTSHNFYPYMTEPGNYTFSVRPTPISDEQKTYMKVGEWTDSDNLELEFENVSDGKGQEKVVTSDEYGVGGWIKEGGSWYFRYPDGNYITNAWAQLDGAWYMFDDESKMVTGWQRTEQGMYYLNESGAMVTGWWQDKNTKNWYYMEPDGRLHIGWLDLNGQRYYLTASGVMSMGWTQIDGKWYYFDPNTGAMYRNTTLGYFYVGPDGAWVE